MTTDVKGNEVRIDSLVQGFSGTTKHAVTARVFMISPWGWIAAYGESSRGSQHVFYPGRYLVRGGPRPEKQRTDVPERLRR